jgi:G3E family GTPase
MADDLDIVNDAIVRASEAVIRALNRTARLIPNAPGQVEPGHMPRFTQADIDRLKER